MEQYVASTRDPIGSRNVFQETENPSEHLPTRRDEADLGHGTSGESSAMAIYLACVAGLLIAALVYTFS